MQPHTWTEITQLFEAALELRPDARDAFLERACAGDAELRREVQSLLEADAQAGKFMEVPTYEEETPTSGATLPSEGGATEPSVDAPEEELKPGSPLGRYVVRERLGTGGMGVVYLADDPELNRKIAIKLMRLGATGNISASEGRARLMREAQAMAQLSHPNVIAVYDVGTFGDQVFIAMEYVEGSTLTQWLAEPDRPWRGIVNMFAQTGRGLAAAHAAGIVHRDFKPDNVLVGKDGRPRVLDFGLARALFGEPERRAPDDERSGADASSPSNLAPLELALTQPGRVMGTLAYMAPEQLMGQDTDDKTDQYSFCVALYQGLYGELPFKGQSIEALVREVTEGRVAEPVSRQLPTPLRRAVVRGLRPDRADRYPSMGALLDELLRQGAARSSIAVLPFVNMSSDKESEYFSDGITEELINALANVDALRVASRTSVFSFKGENLSIQKIGEKLNVGTLVEGSIRREGDRLRIAAQLINVADGHQIWSRTYERELKNIFAVEDELARSIVQALKPKLIGSESAPLVKPPTSSLEAHDLYLQGRYFKEKRSGEALRAAAGFFARATEKDPAYALAWVGLADAAILRCEYDVVATAVPTLGLLSKARQSAQRALELDPRLAEVHATLGLIAQNSFQWAEAEAGFRKAIELNPRYPTAHHWYAVLLIDQARIPEAYAETDRAYRLDPTSPILNNLVGLTRMYDRDFDGAIDAFEKTLEMAPDFGITHVNLAVAYTAQGNYLDALAEYDKAVDLRGSEYLRGLTYVFAGRRAEALRIVEEMEQRARRRYVHPAARGLIWIALGHKDRGYVLLAKACAEADFGLLDVKVNPLFDSMRAEPRFHEVLKCIHLA